MSKTNKPNRFADFTPPANFPPPHWAETVKKLIQADVAEAQARGLRGEAPLPRPPRSPIELARQIYAGNPYHG